MVGGTPSVTVTVKLQSAVFPDPSVAVKVTVETPAGNALPEAKPPVCDTLTPGQLSVATGVVKLAIASQAPGAAASTISVGQVMTGGAASITFTLKLHEAVFPATSVTVKVFTVVPSGKVEPEGSPDVRTVFAIVQSSVPTGAV
jgi:hypothetical protein